MTQGNTFSGLGTISGSGSFYVGSGAPQSLFIGLQYHPGTSTVSAYSSDLMNWTQSTIEANKWQQIIHDETRVVAFGLYGTVGYNNVATTTDGITWNYSRVDFGGNGQYYPIESIIYGGGKFIGRIGGNQVAYSSDLITWSQAYTGSVIAYLAYGNNIFVGINSNDSSPYSTVSSNASNWNYHSMQGNFYSGLVFGNGVFVAPHQGFGVAYSSNGTSWSYGAISILSEGIAFGNGKFVIWGLNQVQYSSDGINWSSPVTLPFNLHSMTFSSGKFIGVGLGLTDSICYSTDALNWSTSTMPFSNRWEIGSK